MKRLFDYVIGTLLIFGGLLMFIFCVPALVNGDRMCGIFTTIGCVVSFICLFVINLYGEDSHEHDRKNGI